MGKTIPDPKKRTLPYNKSGMKTVQNVETIGKNPAYKHLSNVLQQTIGLVPKTNHNADE